MSLTRLDLKVGEETIIGRASVLPPFRASSSMINEARFVYVVKGRSRLHVPRFSVNLSASDSFLMKSENFVNNWLENEDGGCSQVIIVRIIPSVLNTIYADGLPSVFLSKGEADPKPATLIPLNQRIQHFIEGMQIYFESPGMATEEVVKLKLRELIEIISTSGSKDVLAMLSNLFDPNAYKFQEVIESNLFEDLNLSELAHLNGMSLSSFKRKFNELYHSSPTRYFLKKRMERAKHLLETTLYTVSEIAFECGFNDLTHFSKTFKSHVGCNPTHYRSSAKTIL